MNSKKLDSFPTITTPRLYLRNLKESYAKQLFILRSSEIVNKFISRPKPKSQKDISVFIKDRIRDTEKGKIYYWAITLKGNEGLIGTICLWNFSKDNTIAEIGYDLLPKYFKKGIMSEAMANIIDFGFAKLNLKAIEAFTQKNNLSSINLLKRYNFTLESNRKDQGFPLNIIFKLTNIKH